MKVCPDVLWVLVMEATALDKHAIGKVLMAVVDCVWIDCELKWDVHNQICHSTEASWVKEKCLLHVSAICVPILEDNLLHELWNIKAMETVRFVVAPYAHWL